MHFPSPKERPHHTWIPISCGILIGIGILSLFREAKKRPSTEDRLPPRIALEDPTYGLDSNQATDLLVEAIVQVESHGNPTMVGSAGERGLMQIMEDTWKEVTKRHTGNAISFDRAFEPDLNRQVGRWYLGDLQVFLYRNQEKWNSDIRSLLFACYNAGPERVRQADFDLRRLPKVVQSYASRASALHDWYLGDHSEEMREKLIEAGEL